MKRSGMTDAANVVRHYGEYASIPAVVSHTQSAVLALTFHATWTAGYSSYLL